MPRLTDQSRVLLDASRRLLADARPVIEQRGLTLVGLSLTNLEHADRVQLSLCDDWRSISLDAALDDVRDRYGMDAIVRAVLIGRSQGLSMPLLPD